MNTTEKPTKQKRRWPYSFTYEYSDDDRNITYGFSVNADIAWQKADPSVGYMSGYFGDFDFEIASFDYVLVNGEFPNEPAMDIPVTDHETDEIYRKWFWKNRINKHVYEELEQLCIAEFEARHDPDYDL